MEQILIADSIFIIVLVILSVPVGIYIYKVMEGQPLFISKIIAPVEKFLYKLLGMNSEEEMNSKKYTLSMLAFSGVGLIIMLLVQLIQKWLPLNPERIGNVNFDLAFNTAASFVSNTNWQAYAGETTLSYFTQTMCLTVQNFLSAAVGIAVVFVLIRGFIYKQKNTIGNFWKDIIRINLYILIPFSIILAIILMSQGVVQSISPYLHFKSLEGGLSQILPLGPAASQIAIKQIGTNGGGFFGANSAFPFENPTSISNFFELLSILLIPAALCVSFGKAVKDYKQGRALYVVILIIFIVSLIFVTIAENTVGSLEGKEVIHGIGSSSLWGVATTAASNGSVNSMLDSFAPLSGLVLMFLMQIGEVVFGGVGSGLYGMIAFVILTVFIAGLMVGRTPEYLGKKIEPFEMKMVCVVILFPPILTLLGTAVAVLLPSVYSWLSNSGAHGFSEVLYAFSSMANNNGSAFAGYNANTAFTNIFGGIVMLIARFIPMVAIIFLSGSMANKKFVATNEGTLSTKNIMFIGLLISIILLVGALTFLPALALGPIADYFTTLG